MDYLVSYGELALKGKNRRFFEKKLLQSLKDIFKRDKLSMEASFLYGKILVKSREEKALSEEILKNVFGVAALRPVTVFPYDYDNLKANLIPFHGRSASPPKGRSSPFPWTPWP